MSVKNVVKVMNFHSLLRLDKSKKKAEIVMEYEKELTNLICMIINNKNLILDKKIQLPKSNKPKLNIYIASDYGFCSNSNNKINKLINNDKDSDKILIGKKILIEKNKKIKLFLEKEKYLVNYKQIEEIILDSMNNFSHSEINIIYNHYYNVNKVDVLVKKIYPTDFTADEEINSLEDFTIEGDIDKILQELIGLYISYEIRIAELNSYAAENVVRQQITTEALDKIDEIEKEKKQFDRKIKKEIEFKKLVGNFRSINKKEE
ncbi:MAG: F0F1 ATP synthase subunit gamma [Mycoplasmatota bacterium]